MSGRPKLGLPVNREIGKVAVRYDLSVKIVFTGKLPLQYDSCGRAKTV